MIHSFSVKETEKIWEGEISKVIPSEIQQVALRKLKMINNGESINDLRIPPANRLNKLKGKLTDFYSIRINDQLRIVFNWQSNNAENVQITDYYE